ncbi:non-homologous end-joining DNA ligase [Streptomyces sp. H27-C3]|uniref:non-homologous end-joining DNA ligase n=1 Tax=Streptomyces sp. H27-C3 TaxID=3046305 RepID=UPI0024BB01AD|nr:non-homologous end-joining DNA ligase [Streptomyces sp. H27-C3]MDJ0462790.1 non-homologous end-joining DNA ligase [Streptomyces sp. H27-C3]
MRDITSVRAGRRTVRIHRAEKVLFPDCGLTKADVADYYRQMAAFIVPQLRGRPLMLERHPDGVGGPRLMQKDTPDHYPQWMRRVTVDKEGGTVTHTVCDDSATLVFLADQACLTFHRWLSRADRIRWPDRLVFDLDPPGEDFPAVREAAWRLGELLDQLGLPSALMTTGSKGLHVVLPLNGHTSFGEARDFAKEVAQILAERHPDELTTDIREKTRGDRLYLDVQRNAYAQTAVAPWSIRPAPGAPVAAPVSWEQLENKELTARRWAVTDAEDVLVQARTNPWSGLLGRGRALGPARRRLAALR